MSLPVDPGAVRAAHERQLVALIAVRDHLRDATIDPPRVDAAQWRGRAAEAAALFAADLRGRLDSTADAVDAEVRRVRVQIAELS